MSELRENPSPRNGSGQREAVDVPRPRQEFKESAKRPARHWPVVIAVVAVVVFFVFVGLAGVGVGLYVMTSGGKPGSTANDEVPGWRTTALYQQELERVRGEWVQALGSGQGGVVAPKDEMKIGWWDQRRRVPAREAVEAALQRRLGAGWELVKLEPVRLAAGERSAQVDYRVTVRALGDVERARVVRLAERLAGEPKEVVERAKWLVGARQLPAGLALQPVGGLPVVTAGQKTSFMWQVEEAVVEGGVWEIRKAGPVPMEEVVRTPEAWEDAAARQAEVLVSGEELRQASRTMDQSIVRLREELARIDQAVAQARAEAAAGVPARPARSTEQFGGSGSGEPTKTGMRVVGGAATGAAIGGLAGGGEGAGWGALGGAVLGGVYDAASKSGDKKRFEQQKEAEYQARLRSYESARRQAEARVRNVRPALLKELDGRLEREAAEHNARLSG